MIDQALNRLSILGLVACDASFYQLPAALASVLEEPRFRAAAQRYAERHRNRRPERLPELVAAETERVA